MGRRQRAKIDRFPEVAPGAVAQMTRDRYPRRIGESERLPANSRSAVDPRRVGDLDERAVKLNTIAGHPT